MKFESHMEHYWYHVWWMTALTIGVKCHIIFFITEHIFLCYCVFNYLRVKFLSCCIHQTNSVCRPQEWICLLLQPHTACTVSAALNQSIGDDQTVVSCSIKTTDQILACRSQFFHMTARHWGLVSVSIGSELWANIPI